LGIAVLGNICALGLDVDLNTDEELFHQFIDKYNKKYLASEFNFRLQIFKNNLEKAHELNTKDPHAKYGVTQFMDLSPEEFKNMYLIKNFTSPKKNGNVPILPFAKSTSKLTDLPASFDWNEHGVVTGVYNQGACGSCWAFSTTENVESMWAIARHPLTGLSMQQLVDCDTGLNEGCNGGEPPYAYEYIIDVGGLDSYSSYPYTGVDGSCKFNPSDVAATLKSWGYITTTDDETLMAEWTYEYGPPSVCVDAQYWQYYSGGVITENCGDTMDHCVQITGWTVVDGIDAWIVRNSWGTGWGYSGYLYIMMGADVCLIGNEVTSSVPN